MQHNILSQLQCNLLNIFFLLAKLSRNLASIKMLPKQTYKNEQRNAKEVKDNLVKINNVTTLSKLIEKADTSIGNSCRFVNTYGEREYTVFKRNNGKHDPKGVTPFRSFFRRQNRIPKHLLL